MSIVGRSIITETPTPRDAMTSPEADLDSLIADTGAQLDAAQQAVAAGEFVDLTDLLPRVNQVCAIAIAAKSKVAADKLARILPRLDALQAALREQIGRLGVEAKPDPKRAAQTYRAAAVPDERK
jgi:hypothetical protein